MPKSNNKRKRTVRRRGKKGVTPVGVIVPLGALESEAEAAGIPESERAGITMGDLPPDARRRLYAAAIKTTPHRRP